MGGTTNRYVIKINRDRESLKLQTLKISYIDELGNEIILTPELVEEIFEYSLETIPYYVSKLDIEALSNLENAIIEIHGNEELAEGENTITVKITMPSESDEVEDEVLKYTFTVNKETAPKVTLIGKIQNWFKGITGTVGAWFNDSQYKVIMGALMMCCFAMGGLTVYLIMDYKKYKKLLEKVAEITKMNAEKAITPKTEEVLENVENINTETVLKNIKKSNAETEETEEIVKPKGRHF